MLSELLAILAPIMISVGAGFIWGKTGTDFPADFISRIVMNIGTPCLIISVMAKVDVQPSVMGQVALATAIVMTAMGLFGWALLRWMKLEISTYLPQQRQHGVAAVFICLWANRPRARVGLIYGDDDCDFYGGLIACDQQRRWDL